MKISFLESGQVSQNIERLLESKDVDEIDFAIAYLTEKGYSSIEVSLKRFLRKKGQVKFLVGLSGVNITESSALRKLLSLVRKPYGKRLKVKYHNPRGLEFHPKLVIAKSKGKLREVILGSSNLTAGGQKHNVEANVLVEVRDSFNKNAEKFKVDVEQFFDFIWEPGGTLDSYVVREYSKGEKKKTKSSLASGGAPKTSLPSFIYLDEKRISLKFLKVLCTACKRKYVKIPLNAFYCEKCGEKVMVEMPSLNKKEREQKKRLQRVTVKVDDKKLHARKVALRCPICNAPIDLTDESMLWIICQECGEKRKKSNEVVSKPFSKWNNSAKNLFYSLDTERITYSRK